MRILLAFSFSLLFALSSFQAAASNKQADEVSKKQAVLIAKKAEDGRTLKITEQEKHLGNPENEKLKGPKCWFWLAKY